MSQRPPQQPQFPQPQFPQQQPGQQFPQPAPGQLPMAVPIQGQYPQAQGYPQGMPQQPVYPGQQPVYPGQQPVYAPQPGYGPPQAYPTAQPLPQQYPYGAPNPAGYVPHPVAPVAQPVGPQPIQPTAIPQAVPVQPGAAPRPQPMPVAMPVAQPAAAQPGVAARPIAAPKPVASKSSGAVNPDAPAEGEEDQDEITNRLLKNSPPWLISSLVHLIAIVIMGLLVIAVQQRPKVELEIVYSDELGEQLIDDSVALTGNEDVEQEIFAESPLEEVDDPFATPPEFAIETVNGMTATDSVQSLAVGIALSGRSEGSRRALLSRYGGNATTEAAVLAGLEWLAKQQRPDGSWSLEGPYPDASRIECVESATAMALLAFQGAGHTHKSPGKFRENVARGIQALIKLQRADGDFFQQVQPHDWLYSQAQATIAICELYAMTEDPDLVEPARTAIEFCVNAQDPALGGWRYAPKQDSDTSVTGWMIMALQSARMGRITVPSTTLDNVMLYLDKATDDGGIHYGYQPGHFTNEVMTAEALLCRQYLGWERDDPRLQEGVEYLLANKPNFNERNVYYWYYATQVLHHMEGEQWKEWNEAIRDPLVDLQESRGPEKGSWSPSGDLWGDRRGGRLYTTCLSIFILEVYYRHLPIYAGGRPPAG